jgi:hypothetical protein
MPKITISTGDSKKTNNKIPAAVFERAMSQKTLSPHAHTHRAVKSSEQRRRGCYVD